MSMTPPIKLKLARRCTSTRIVLTAWAGVLVLAVVLVGSAFAVAVGVNVPLAFANVKGVYPRCTTIEIRTNPLETSGDRKVGLLHARPEVPLVHPVIQRRCLLVDSPQVPA